MNKLIKSLGAAAASLALTVGTAHAAVPAEVQTAIDGMKADGVTVAVGVLLAVVAFKVIKFIGKAF